MEIKVNIDTDTILANTETATAVSNIVYNDTDLTYTHEPSFVGFYNKITAIVKEKKNVELRNTINTSGESITWVTILSNSTTSSVFDIFRTLGVYAPKLTIGINEKSHIIYTSSKLCRDLNKFSESQKAAFVMYMLTLAYFVDNSIKYCIEYTFNPLSNNLSIKDTSSYFDKCIYKFTEESTWYLKDANDDNYLNVYFYNTKYTSTNDQYANVESVHVGLLRHVSGKYLGIASVGIGASKYTFLITSKSVITDFELCNIEISPESICSHILSAFEGTVNLQKIEKLPLNNEVQIMEFDSDNLKEFAKTEKIPDTIVTWLTNMFSKGVRNSDVDDLAYLSKLYGVTVPMGASSTMCLSFDEMKKSYDKDEYAQELYKQIKPYYDTYNLGDALNANLKGFSNGALYALAFIGESGTGKSTAARVIPARVGIPYVSVNFSVNIEEADLFGSMVPNSKKLRPEDPEFVWADGIITKAVRNGYCVILEELNFARPGVLGKLNSLLDENRQIDLATGEIVRAHQNFRIIATCNIAYEGTNRFNKALINRFDDVTIFKDLSRNEAISVIKSRTGYSNITKIAKVYDVYEALKKFAVEQNVNAVVSMRQLLNIFTKGKYYNSAKDAVQRIMINGAFIEDAEYQKMFEETVFGAFDLKFKI